MTYFVRGVVFELLSAAFVIVMYQDSKVLLVLKFTRLRTNFHFGTIRKLYALQDGRKFAQIGGSRGNENTHEEKNKTLKCLMAG